MNHRRIGVTRKFIWKDITTNGEEKPLEGRDLALVINHKFGKEEPEFTVNGNTLTFVWEGTRQRFLGEYTLTLWENRGKTGQSCVDKECVFLVDDTRKERDEDSRLMIVESIILEGGKVWDYSQQVSSIADVLDSSRQDLALSANQGRVLDGKVSQLNLDLKTLDRNVRSGYAEKRQLESAENEIQELRNKASGLEELMDSLKEAGYPLGGVLSKETTITVREGQKAAYIFAPDLPNEDDAAVVTVQWPSGRKTVSSAVDNWDVELLVIDHGKFGEKIVNKDTKIRTWGKTKLVMLGNGVAGSVPTVAAGLKKPGGETAGAVIPAIKANTEGIDRLGQTVGKYAAMIVDLGNFNTSEAAEAKAAELKYCADERVVMMRYSANSTNSKETGLITQRLGKDFCIQRLSRNNIHRERAIMFTDSNRMAIREVTAWYRPVNGDDIVDKSVTENKIADKAVTAAKLGEEALLVPITHEALKTSRDTGRLLPGATYRITDYRCTTTQEGTQAADHVFDILVQAIDNRTLSEEARAARHAGDTYFQHCKVEAWRLSYALDNDQTRFTWADPVNGKGVIWRFEDEHGNNIPYDFKNIKFQRYKAKLRGSDEEACYCMPTFSYDLEAQLEEPYMSASAYLYTFSYTKDESELDTSSVKISSEREYPGRNTAQNVRMEPCFANVIIDEGKVLQAQTLNNNCFTNFKEEVFRVDGVHLSGHCLMNTFKAERMRTVDVPGEMYMCIFRKSLNRVSVTGKVLWSTASDYVEELLVSGTITGAEIRGFLNGLVVTGFVEGLLIGRECFNLSLHGDFGNLKMNGRVEGVTVEGNCYGLVADGDVKRTVLRGFLSDVEISADVVEDVSITGNCLYMKITAAKAIKNTRIAMNHEGRKKPHFVLQIPEGGDREQVVGKNSSGEIKVWCPADLVP